MSGLVGLWYRDGRPVDPEVLAAMSRAMAHRGPDGEGQVVSGAVGMAYQHLWVTPEEVGERQPLGGPSGELLVFDGRLDNREALCRRFDLPENTSDAALALRACLAWGEGAARHLEGDFALGFYDPRRRRLVLARDAIGVRPLYVYRDPRLVAFASEIKALLAHPEIPARPDEQGLAGYLFLGRGPLASPERTCFAGIHTVPPAHRLVIESEGDGRPERYWDFELARQVRLGSFGEYVEAFAELFARAVARRTRSAYPIAVSLSGGLDSSSIFCQAETLRRAGAVSCPAVRAFAYVGAEGSAADERAYLEHIERAYGVAVERLALGGLLGLAYEAERQAWISESPMLDNLWPVTQQIEQAAAASGARRFLSGHWGDQMLHCTAYLVDLFRRGRWLELGRHLVRLDQWFHQAEARALRRQAAFDLVRSQVPRLLVPPLKWLRRRLAGPDQRRPWLAAESRRRALRGANRPATLGNGFASAQARSLYLEVRLPYTAQCLEWNNKAAALHGLDHAFPMLDRDLVAFLLATPGEVHSYGGVPRALIREALRGILPEAVRLRRWKGDYSDPVNQGAERDFAAVEALFADQPRSVAWGYVDGRRARAYLARLAPALAGPDCTASWELADLLGLEQWFRVFLSVGAPPRRADDRPVPGRPR